MESNSPGAFHLPFPTLPTPAFPLPPPLPPSSSHPPAPSLASLFPDLNPFAQAAPSPLPASSASSPAPLLRLRLIELDSYTAAPIASLDPSHSLFSSSPLTHVPVLRVWGCTPAGQHLCLHIHRYFPYLYVPMPPETAEDERAEKDVMRRLGLSLERALREVDARRRQQQDRAPAPPPPPSSSSASAPPAPPERVSEHLYSLTLHTATDFYGYHAHRARFIKLSFLSPSSISIASSILLSGALLGRVFQPYEAHIPFQLQFMVDAHLAGMEFVDVSWVGFRRGLGRHERGKAAVSGEGVREWNERMRLEAALSSNREEKDHAVVEDTRETAADAELQTDIPSPAPTLASFTAVPLGSRIYSRATLPASLYVSGKVPRLTTCELEADCSFYHIANRGRGITEKGKPDKPTDADDEERPTDTESKKRLVRSLQLLWENEKERRRQWHEEERQRKERKRQRRTERRRRHAGLFSPEESKVAMTAEDDLQGTPSSTLEFSQFAPSPPRVLPPPSELELALARHLRAVARQEHPPSQPSQRTPATPQSTAPTPRRPPVPTFDWDAVSKEQPPPAAEALAMPEEKAEASTRVAEDVEAEAEPAEVNEDEEGAALQVEQMDGLLQSAIANADVPLTPTATARLPSVAAFLSSQAPVEEEEQLAATQVLPAEDDETAQRRREEEEEWAATQVQREMDEKAEVDEDILLSSQQRIARVAQLTQSTRDGLTDDTRHPAGDDDDSNDVDLTQPTDGAEEEPRTPTRRPTDASAWASGRSSGSGRGRIIIEDDSSDDDDAAPTAAFIRIPQLDGADDSDDDTPSTAQLRAPPARAGKYSSIPLLPMEEEGKAVGAGDEDVIMIPSTPPNIFTRVLHTSSPSGSPSSSTSSPRSAAFSRAQPLSSSGSGRRSARTSGGLSGARGSSGGSGRRSGRRGDRSRVQDAALSAARRRDLLPLLELAKKSAVEDIDDEPHPPADRAELPAGDDDIEDVPTAELGQSVRRRILLSVDDSAGRERQLAAYDEDGEEVLRGREDSEEEAGAVEGDDSTVYSEMDHAAAVSASRQREQLVEMVEDSIDEIFITQSSSSAASPAAVTVPAPDSAHALPPPSLANVATAALLPASSRLLSEGNARLTSSSSASHVSPTPTPEQIPLAEISSSRQPRAFLSTPHPFSPSDSQSSDLAGHRRPTQQLSQQLVRDSAGDVMETEDEDEVQAGDDRDDSASVLEEEVTAAQHGRGGESILLSPAVIDLITPTPSPAKAPPPTPTPPQTDARSLLFSDSSIPPTQPIGGLTEPAKAPPARPSSVPPSEEREDRDALSAAQAPGCAQWWRQWSSTQYSDKEPLQWVRLPLSLSSSTSFVHIVSTPPPSPAVLEATWAAYDLPSVVNSEPFFSSLQHYQSHIQSTTAQIAVAHYQSSYAATSASPLKSLVLPPPSAVDLLPAFQPVHASADMPRPPSVGFDPVPAEPAASIPPLPDIAYAQMRRLFFSAPRLADGQAVLEYGQPPPSYEQVEASLIALQQPQAAGGQSQSSGSSPQEERTPVPEAPPTAVVEDGAEEEEDDDEEEDAADDEVLRPASPKFEENFLSTLSYFLPPLPRKQLRNHTPSSATQSALTSSAVPKRVRDSGAVMTPEKKRPRPLFNLAQHESPLPSFPSPAKVPSSQLSATVGDMHSLPVFAPPPPTSSTSSAEDRQHMTILSVEMHACSRGELLPDPRMDPVTAIICAVRWDVHARDDERREAQCVLLCPYLPQHGSVSSACPGPCQCPPLSFPASVSVQLFASEMALFRAFVEFVLSLDPDLVYSYEIQKNGLGYLAERARWLNLDLMVELSRVRKDEKRLQWKRRQILNSTLPHPPLPPPPAIPSTATPPHSPPLSPQPHPSITPGLPPVAAALPTPAVPAADRPPESGFSTGAGSSDNPAERYAFNHSSGLTIPGRIVLNLWRLFRDELKLTIYTYENVTAHVLGSRAPFFSYQTRTRWWKHGIRAWNDPALPAREGAVGTGDLQRLLSWYLGRVRTSLVLIDKLDLIGRTSELARVFGLKFYNVLDRGSQFRVESMMLRVAKPKNFVLASLSPEQRAAQAGMEIIPLIMEPLSRMYVDPVIVLDFQSLYPSMMIAYNICYSTCIGKLPPLGAQGEAAKGAAEVTHQLGGLPLSRPAALLSSLLSSNASSLWVSPSGTVFTTPAVRQGVLPLLLRDILQTRVMVKQTMRRLELRHDAPMQRVLNARQFGLKLISNVTYGYTAAGFSGRMPCAEIADAIVSAARMTLEKAIERVEGNAAWKAKVVYGDTDSLFVLLEGRTREDAFRIGREMADDITRANPSPVRLQMEKVYMPCMLVSKKRYVGMKWETPTGGAATLDCKGLEMVRRDGCPALVRVQENALRALFAHKDVSLVRRYVEREWSRIYTGDVLVKDFIFAKEVRLGTYKVLPLAAIVATNSIKQDARTAPLYGERVEYVVIDAEGSRLMDKALTPQELLAHPSRYRLSASYYIEKQLVPPLSRLFDLLGVSVAGWYAQWARPRRKLYAPPPMEEEGGKAGAGGKKRTIDHYYASQHCPGCDVVTTRGYCEQCRRAVGSLVLRERLERRDVEERMQELVRTCRTCIGTGYIGARAGEERPYALEVECESRDCPIMFKRHSTREQTRDVEHRAKLLADVVR